MIHFFLTQLITQCALATVTIIVMVTVSYLWQWTWQWEVTNIKRGALANENSAEISNTHSLSAKLWHFHYNQRGPWKAFYMFFLSNVSFRQFQSLTKNRDSYCGCRTGIKRDDSCLVPCTYSFHPVWRESTESIEFFLKIVSLSENIYNNYFTF